MLILQASNIHEGGSKTLFASVLEELCNKNPNEDVVIFLDERFDRSLIAKQVKKTNLKIENVKPSILSRLSAEFKIHTLSKQQRNSTLLCFGNLPPLFSSKARVVLFFQTVLYFNQFNKFINNPRNKIKIYLESIWIKFRISSVNYIYVQSSFIKKNLIQEYNVDSNKVVIQPFADLAKLKNSFPVNSLQEGFFYPAIGTSHKNHRKLIDAWILLGKDNIFPLLILTLDSRFSDLLEYLDNAKKEHNISFKNLGLISHDSVLAQLSASQAMIFPSYCESFGLPLLEARENNIQIIAGELDFVRDILNPVETFDPDSALSIARAIKRFLKIKEEPIIINTTDSFIDLILRK